MEANYIFNSFAGLLNDLGRKEVTQIWGDLFGGKLKAETMHASREFLKSLSCFKDEPTAYPLGYSVTMNDKQRQEVNYLGKTFVVHSDGDSPTAITEKDNLNFKIALPLDSGLKGTKTSDFAELILETAKSVKFH